MEEPPSPSSNYASSRSDWSEYEAWADHYERDAFCYICSSQFDGTPMDFRRAPPAGAGQSELFLSAFKIEEMYALSFAGWRTLYRIVMYNPEVQAYQLSGVAQKPFQKRWWYEGAKDKKFRFIAPRDENDGVLEIRQVNQLHPDRLVAPKLVMIGDDMEKQTTLAGYLVHALCWRELLRLNHRSSSEGDLSLVSRALRRRCLRRRLYLQWWFYVPIRELVEMKDPIATASVRQLVKECRSRAVRGTHMKATSRAVDSRIPLLPQELQCMIMDQLEYQDIRQMLRALKWIMDPSYWRRRLDVHFFSEIQFLEEDKGLDWQWLCLRVEALKDSEAGANRQRFFEMLRKYTHMDVFHAELASLRNDDMEGRVNGIWNIILNAEFPVSEGYVHRPQDGVTGGFTDFKSIQWVLPEGEQNLQQRAFLVTQCKRPEVQYRDSAWQEARDQLVDYLRGVRRSARGRRYGIYGILGLGKFVEFYKFNTSTNSLDTLGAGRRYTLGEHDAMIRGHIRTIKNNNRNV
ncbi:hypothetical protein AbraIFM66950_006405 [Aspergillus brasiliensis]|nr:hypothetical protein AbraIFM66950_006405 [Aspergillus brasiliensis]